MTKGFLPAMVDRWKRTDRDAARIDRKTRTDAVESVADAVLDAIGPPRRHALTDAELDAQFQEIRANSARRRARFRRLTASRPRWPRYSEDELVELVTAELRQRPRTNGNGRRHAGRTARVG